MTLLGRMGRLIQLHEEAEPLARQLDDQSTLGRICQRMSTYAWVAAQYEKGLAYAEQALGIAERTSDASLRVSARYALGLHWEGLGRYRDAMDVFGLILEGPDADIAKRVPGLHVFAYIGSGGWLALCLAMTGNFIDAEKRAYGALDAGPRDPLAEAMLANLVAVPAALKGDFERALGLAARVVALCESKRVAAWLPHAYSLRGWIATWLHRTDEGLGDLERGVSLHESGGARTHLALLYVRWAEAQLIVGDWQRARESAERARLIAVETRERAYEVWALQVLGEVLSTQVSPDYAMADEHYRAATALAAEHGLRPLLAHCHAGRARLYRRTDKQADAEQHYEAAVALYRAMGMRYWLEKIEREMTK
jgi:tetratricopeptide (TPR) repeat protein